MRERTATRSIFIEGRLWFDKTYGNTYNSVSVRVDGRWVVDLPMEYGYGDQYLWRALEWLAANGWVERDDRGQAPSTYELGQRGIDIYSTSYHVTKKELYKANARYGVEE